MNKKNILIFEDDWATIRGSFDLANIFSFENTLEFKNVIKSQDVDYKSLKDLYDVVFVDITLAKNTEMDGFSIIKMIFEEKFYPLEKLVVLSGNSKVEERLKEMEIPTDKITVLYKPISFDILAKELKKILDK